MLHVVRPEDTHQYTSARQKEGTAKADWSGLKGYSPGGKATERTVSSLALAGAEGLISNRIQSLKTTEKRKSFVIKFSFKCQLFLGSSTLNVGLWHFFSSVPTK